MITRKRIIPSLLCKQSGLVKGTQFDNWRNVGPLLPSVKIFEKRDIDEIIIINLDASMGRREIPYVELQRTLKFLSCPSTYGGGVKNLSDVESLLKIGFDKILVTTEFLKRPTFLKEIVTEFGSQVIMTSIDTRLIENKYIMFSNCGTLASHFDLTEWCSYLSEHGIGEIIINDIDLCGMYHGHNRELVELILESTTCGIVLGSGTGDMKNLASFLKQKRINAVAIGSLFHFTEATPNTVRMVLDEEGVNVRIPSNLR